MSPAALTDLDTDFRRRPCEALSQERPANGARILAKWPGTNPTGSTKDPMALAIVEPAESPDLRAGHRGAHLLERTAVTLPPPLLDDALFDRALAIPEAGGREKARRLAREEDLFARASRETKSRPRSASRANRRAARRS